MSQWEQHENYWSHGGEWVSGARWWYDEVSARWQQYDSDDEWQQQGGDVWEQRGGEWQRGGRQRQPRQWQRQYLGWISNCGTRSCGQQQFWGST